MYIHQQQLGMVKKLSKPNKAVILYGPRRVGKTTLLSEYLKAAKLPYLLVNGEDIHVRKYLSSESIEQLKNFIGDHQLLVVDEAQKIQNIGINLKLIIDHIKGIRVIATGSSTFDLARNVGEPLTGRKFTVRLFPLSQLEISRRESMAQTMANLETRLIYGSYPEVVISRSNTTKALLLKEIVNSYLLKDILELEGLRNHKKIQELLQLIAFQVGKEVSYAELGSQLGMSKNTIERYLGILEEVFVITRVGGFSRNLRKEIKKNSRYYFYDTGIRNALINNFNPLNVRNDSGELWENYLFMERMKKREYQGIQSNIYFWRTYTQQEIDLVEERGGKLFGYEFKWSPKKTPKLPSEWKRAYPEAHYSVITPENYLEFIA